MPSRPVRLAPVAAVRVDVMTRADPPEHVRFFGVRENPLEPPIHAIEESASETLCGVGLDADLGVVFSFEPFMSAAAISEMLFSRVPPCETCRQLVEAAEGPPGEL
jgi:hypothetical protein